MAHNNFGAFGYGDGSSYGGDSANTDSHYGWSNWSSSDNSEQQKYQQSQNPYDNYGYSQPQGYNSFNGSNFNSFGSFPQKSRQGVGFNSASGPDWSQKHFGSPSGQGKKQKNANIGPQQGYRMSPQQPMKKEAKPIVTAGKTPTSVLHELFKNITEDYTESGTTPKTYICKLNVDGQTFQGEASNKKSAKHKCSEVALQNLRPDLHIEPFVETVKAAAVKKEESNEVNQLTPPKKQQKRTAPATKSEDVKKQKLSPIEAAASLFDLMNRIIADSSEKYVPVFEVTEQLPPQPKVEVKQEEEPIEADQSVAPKKEKKVPKWFKDPATIFTVTLKFEEQGKQYQKVGTGRGTQRTLVIREALIDLFKVSMNDIKAVTLKGATQRLHHFSNVSTLYSIAATLGCTVHFDIDLSEAKPLGEGKPFYFAKCKVVSNDDPEKTGEFKSSDSLSKTIAKEQVALLALTQFFQLDPSKCKKKTESAASLGPAATLHTYLQQGKAGDIKVDYEYKDVEPKTNPPSFSCDCIIGEKRFTAIGSSKKSAKNNVAIIALKELFSVEYDPQASEQAVQKAALEHNVSGLCRDIAEFAKREYHGMCGHYNVRPSNQVACFFLVNEKEEKRLISTGSSMQNIVDTVKLDGAMGQTLVHMDAIVLARRSLLRYFIQELAVLESDPENSIFVINKGNKADLKPNLKLLLYSNFPPVCNMSVRDAKVQKLAYVTPINFTPVPEDVMTSAKIRESKEIRVHCTADKLYKWNTVGLQGALLSNLLNTIKLDAIFFGTDAPVSDDSLKFALSGRLNENTNGLQLESIATQMRVVTSYSHGWTRGIDSVEKLDHTTGVTHDGFPSKYSKAALFDSYLRLANSDSSVTNYSAAKQKGTSYQKSKKAFYAKLEKAGLGKWQTKPSDFLDNFSITPTTE